MVTFRPGKPRYLSLLENGELEERASKLAEIYRSCTLCPHRCSIDRTAGELGRCRSTHEPMVASAAVHHGEEPAISGDRGSGTIFFSACTGRCIFCQNYPISQLGTGKKVTSECLAEMMLSLQFQGCHNINLVTPTHFIPSVVKALLIAARKGLVLPIVYNTSGYESVKTLVMLESIIDIYLPDIKYADDDIALELSGFKNYTKYNRCAIKEMFRQVGNLKVYKGIATGGMIVRHLVLPDRLAGTLDCMKFLAEISPDMRVSLMDQYFPAYKAVSHQLLSRKITESEYDAAIDDFHSSGLKHGWIQIHEK